MEGRRPLLHHPAPPPPPRTRPVRHRRPHARLIRPAPEDDLFPNPDFELYDNVGRTTEQIHAYNLNQPTEDDLRRWGTTGPAASSAAPPDALPGHAITPWTDKISRTETLEDFQEVLDRAAISDDGALSRLHQLLETAALWCERHDLPHSAQRMTQLTDALARIGDDLAFLLEDITAEVSAPGARAAAATNRARTSGPAHQPSAVPPATETVRTPRRR